jgi:AraC family transcriptional regulator of adaptative response/methylated-DNA-[protein]-cysteine methyltransferase
MTGDLFTREVPDLHVRVRAEVEPLKAKRAAGLRIVYGWHDGPFGRTLVMASAHGLCGLAFAASEREPASGDYDEDAALANMTGRWPSAAYKHDAGMTAPLMARVFEPERWRADDPLPLHLFGSPFDMQVWDALVRIPVGRTLTYSDIAEALGRPSAARAVGAAVGANPVSFAVPCHRVIGRSGALTGYHWGVGRKRRMLDWERALVEAGRADA